jgi:hypothetical protein
LLQAQAGDPIPRQRDVVQAFEARTVASKVIYDREGHAVKLALSNHTGTGFWKDASKTPPPGVDDELLRRVLELPRLEAVALEKQPISDKGYRLLAQLHRLRDVRLHYMNAAAGATRDAPLFINRLPLPLEVLELKHNFGIKGGCMDRLKPQPGLRKLEIDTGYADRSAVGFIKHSPNLVNLQMHRTRMNDADLQEVFASVPNVEILLIRPSGQRGPGRITGRSLRGIAACPKLRLVILGLEWGAFPYEGGLETLTRLPRLEKVTFAPSDLPGFGLDTRAIQRLHQARPDVEIRIRNRSIGGVEGRRTEQEDADWKWDGGVTTHG